MAHSTPRRIALALLAPAALLLVASQAQAHAHLTSASPAPNASAPAGVKTVALQFSEPVVARFSGFDVTAANGSKVAMAPAAVDPKSPKALTANLKAPLTAGSYKVTWHVVSADTHRMQGAYNFTVR